MLQIIGATTTPLPLLPPPLRRYSTMTHLRGMSHRLPTGYRGEVHRLHDKLTPEQEQKKQSIFHQCCSRCYPNVSHGLRKT